jgi:multidrug efflux pump subunit AcrA (membrane-fusion protein)
VKPLAPFVTAVAVLATSLTGCTTAGGPVSTVGTVTDPSRTIMVPALTLPTVNLDAGFAPAAGTSGPTMSTSTPNTVAATYQAGTSQRVATLKVAEGTPVTVGQVVATLDTTALKAQVSITKADRDVALAQVGVLDSAIDKTYTAERTLKANRAKVTSAISTLTSTLSDLRQAKPQLVATRADLAAKLNQAEYLLAHYPPVPPPGTPTKPELQARIAQLKAAIAGLDAKLAQVNAALPQLTSGLKQARAGLAKLNQAFATLTDARAQLRGLRDLARIAAQTADIPVSVARAQLSQATLTSPVAGVVTWTAGVGDRVITGAPVVTIRETGPAKVTAWLSPSQLSRVCAGDAATITGDWMAPGQTMPASLSWISPTADFPPSSTATDETHLTRAVRVELLASGELPAGVPVEISIPGCHPTAGQSEQDR